MGYIRHNAIVITSWKDSAIEAVAAFAKEQCMRVLGPDTPGMNGYRSLLICPDGSKEGWEDSDIGDERRAKLKEHMATYRHEDGSSPLCWVEIAYGSDDREAVIEDDEWRSGAVENVAVSHQAETIK